MSVIDKFIKRDNYISLPDIATRLLEILQSDEVDINELVKLVESDPIISMKLIRLANSPVYHVKTEIIDLRQAMQILGTKRISDIIFSISLHSKLFVGRNLDIYPLLEKYFYNSYLIGNISRIFTEYINDQSKNGLFVSGLLHDIGRMIMIQTEPVDYMKVIELIDKEKVDEIEAEDAVFHESHIKVGSKLSEIWDLPEMVNSVIRFYREPDKAHNYRKINFGVNSSKQYVDNVTAEDLKDLSNISIANFKNYESLNRLLNIGPKKELIDANIRTIVKNLPDSYALFK